MTDHFMELTAHTDDYVEFTCDTCGRVIRISREFGIQIMEPGDQMIQHSGSTVGWIKMAVEVGSPTKH